jgi:hypothetical protein
MSKKKKTERQLTAEELKEVCLHCAFFTMHQDKWPDWRADGNNVSQDAFNDLVRSTVKIVAEVFTMLDPIGQMTFMRKVMETYAKHMDEQQPDHTPHSLSELITILMNNVDETKH